MKLRPNVEHHLAEVLHHLYINPLEKCNLRCKICYTKKTDPILPNDQILDFVQRYQAIEKVETITFCGGEVFALKDFPKLVNALTDQGIFIQMITNGTINRLKELRNENLINIITSLDSVESYHDQNRGKGTFQQTLSLMKEAHRRGFHLDVFSIVTHQNLPLIDAFEASLADALGFTPIVTYHPRKPPTYLTVHPVSNIVGETNGFDFLEKEELRHLMATRNVFPPKDLGCYQISLMSDGRVFGCCEGITPLGRIEDDPALLVGQLRTRIETWAKKWTGGSACLGCSQSEFMCGIKEFVQHASVIV